ncbi:MAG: DUF3465 domain-containing protein [Thermovirgaceae bacterium]
MKMKKTALFFVILIALVYGAVQTVQPVFHEGNDIDRATKSNDLLARLYEKGETAVPVPVSGEGRVVSILPDDEKGSRHQRFVIELDSGQTLLVAHNIDVAPRIGTLRMGDRVEFYGEYEWNPQGGVIHWTHRDPSGRHPHGWIVHNGRKYW